MDAHRAITAATKRLLTSKAFRTFDGYTLDIVRDGDTLVCTTWGYDYERIAIPQTQADIAKMNYEAQLFSAGEMQALRLRYAQEILHNESAVSMAQRA